MIWHDMVITISRKKVLKWCVVVSCCCSPGPASRKCTCTCIEGRSIYSFIIIIIIHHP